MGLLSPAAALPDLSLGSRSALRVNNRYNASRQHSPTRQLSDPQSGRQLGVSYSQPKLRPDPSQDRLSVEMTKANTSEVASTLQLPKIRTKVNRQHVVPRIDCSVKPRSSLGLLEYEPKFAEKTS